MDINTRSLHVCIWWITVLGLVFLLKYHYSTADAWNLQWILQPLALITKSLTGLNFAINNAGEWVNWKNNIAIAKSCAGVNFMILSMLVYAVAFSPARNPEYCLETGFIYILINLLLCLTASFSTALLVNSFRILVAVQLYISGTNFAGLNMEQVHRIAGILVYFPALWLQLYIFCRMKSRHAGVAAILLYWGMVILVPLATGNYRINPSLFVEHIFFTCGVTLLLYMFIFMIKLSYRLNR